MDVKYAGRLSWLLFICAVVLLATSSDAFQIGQFILHFLS